LIAVPHRRQHHVTSGKILLCLDIFQHGSAQRYIALADADGLL
jgi:hypothetical protein